MVGYPINRAQKKEGQKRNNNQRGAEVSGVIHEQYSNVARQNGIHLRRKGAIINPSEPHGSSKKKGSPTEKIGTCCGAMQLGGN